MDLADIICAITFYSIRYGNSVIVKCKSDIPRLNKKMDFISYPLHICAFAQRHCYV